MNCPSCGAPMKLAQDLASVVCEYCKRVEFLEKNEEGVCVLEEIPTQDCPGCQRPLHHATLHGARLDYCVHCRGMLFAMESFPVLIAAMRVAQPGSDVPAPASSDELRRKVLCPRCHTAMDTHFYYGGGSVVVDNCDHCDVIWLDHGELLRIVHAPHGS